MTRRWLLLTALMLAACGGSSGDESRLAVTVVGAPWAGGLGARLEAEATRPTLVARDSSGAIVPGLATSWRFVDDDNSLILRLRPREWDDGIVFSAGQVVAAFGRAGVRREPALSHAAITTTRAPISRVVEIRLAAASPHLLDWLSDPGLAITRPVRRAGGIAPSLASYSGSGPAEARVLKRRDAAASPMARPAEITLNSIADPVAAVARFTKGEADIVIGDGLAGLGEARTVARPQTLSVDALWGIYGYIANTRSGPLKDPQLRLALSLAVDRAALSARIGLAAMAPVNGLLPPSLRPIPLATLDTPTEALLARQVLKTARGDETTPIRLTLLLPPGRDHRVIADRVAADWRPLGVEVVISQADAASIADKVRRGAFDLALTEASLAVPDAAALLARWRCGGGLACDAAADALWAKAQAAPLAERPALLAEAEAKWLEAPPMIPLLTPLRWALVAPGVDGWSANPAGVHPLARLAVTGRK
jgi:ABC-type transport system substrate-binding protein